MKLYGLVSSYVEGPLVRMAIQSALRACDHVYVFEGPAGPDRCLDAPLSDLTTPWEIPELTIVRGEWQTDAAKRTAIVKHVQPAKPEPVWGVWIDGDEVLMQGEFLRDWLQALVWEDEASGDTTVGFPIRIVEMDGSVAICRAKCLRVDQISNYVVSSSGIKLKNGVTVAEGNLPQKLTEWWNADRMRVAAGDRLMLEPPLPGEPYLLHRSPLRHPARRGLRMHEQEAAELERLGLWTPSGA